MLKVSVSLGNSILPVLYIKIYINERINKNMEKSPGLLNFEKKNGNLDQLGEIQEMVRYFTTGNKQFWNKEEEYHFLLSYRRLSCSLRLRRRAGKLGKLWVAKRSVHWRRREWAALREAAPVRRGRRAAEQRRKWALGGERRARSWRRSDRGLRVVAENQLAHHFPTVDQFRVIDATKNMPVSYLE